MSFNYSILDHSYDIIDKDIFKNCKSKLLLGNYELIIEELLKKFNFNKENVSNNNFKTLLKSLSVVGMKIYEDNISCNRNNIGVLICATNLSNIIKIKKISIDNNPDYLLLDNNNIEKNLVCKTKTKLNYEITSQSITNYTQKYKQLKNTMSNQPGSNANKFIFNGFNYLITYSNNDRAQTKPTRMEMITELSQFYDYNKQNIDKILDLFYSLINEMIFFYLPNDFFKQLDQLNKADIDFFKKIKENITNYVNSLFIFVFKEKAKSLFNNYNLKINISINDNNITYIYFYLFNKLNQTIYIPYYNIYNSIDIDDLIYCLENCINYLDSFYNFTNEKNAFKHEMDCKKIYSGVKDWTEKDFTAKPINNTYEYINLLTLQQNIEKIKILSYYPGLNKQHENCTITMNIELENKYYYISIMSITMQEFNKIETISNTNKFKEDYINKLKKIIVDNEISEINQVKIINEPLPSILKVMIKQLDTKPEKINNLYINETAKDYYNIVLPDMIKKSIINPNLILLHLWLSEYRKILNKFPNLDKLFFIEKYIPILNKEIKEFIELTKNFLKIDDICFVMLTVIDFTDNFVMIYKISNITELISFYHKKKSLNVDINKQELLNKINNLACNVLDYENYIKINKDKLDILLNELFNDIVTDETFYLFISKYIREAQFSYMIWYVPKNLSIQDNTSNFEPGKQYRELAEVKEGEQKKPPIITLLKILTKNLEFLYNKADFRMNDIIKGHLQIKFKTFEGADEIICADYKIINMISNFYDLYLGDNFAYNIRHFNDNLYTEMKNLLMKTQKYDLLIFCHYPNDNRLNILHWHIYPDNFATDDIVGKKIDTSVTRAIFFDKINNANFYKNKDMIITLPIKIKGETITYDDLIKDKTYLVRKNIMLNNIILSNQERINLESILIKIKEEEEKSQKGGKNYYKLYNKYKNKYINLKNDYKLL